MCTKNSYCENAKKKLGLGRGQDEYVQRFEVVTMQKSRGWSGRGGGGGGQDRCVKMKKKSGGGGSGARVNVYEELK